jgi:hypothetical protein
MRSRGVEAADLVLHDAETNGQHDGFRPGTPNIDEENIPFLYRTDPSKMF